MKRIRPAIAFMLAAAVLFACGSCSIGNKSPFGDEEQTLTSDTQTTAVSTTAVSQPDTASPAQTATVPADTAAPTEESTTAFVYTTLPTTQQPQTTQPVMTEPPTLSPQQVTENNIALMCAAVNEAKHTANFSATKIQKVSFEIKDCSVPVIIPMANKIVEKLAHDNVKEYNFINGYSVNPKKGEPDITPAEALPPTDRDIVIDSDGLLSFDVTQVGNDTVYTAVIAKETVSLDDQVPYYHSLAADYIDLSEYDIRPAELTKADITYHEAIVKVSVDNTTGKLSGFEQTTPITSIGSAKLFGFTADGIIEGNLYESWTFNW